MALTKVGGDIIRQPLDIGSLNATTLQIGAATTVHTTGIDVGGGSVTGHNIHSTGIVTATSFVGPVTGNASSATVATNAQGLTGSPSITVTDITTSGNVSIGGTLTYEDVTNIDSVGVITARSGINVTGGNSDFGNYSTYGTRIKPSNGIGIKADGNPIREVFHVTNTTDSSTKIQFLAGGDGIFQGRVSVAQTIAHAGDTNTNIQFPAADTITAETAGSERLRITSGGNVLIGTPTGDTSRNSTSTRFPVFQVASSWSSGRGSYSFTTTDDYPVIFFNSNASYANGSGAGTLVWSVKDGSGDYCNTAQISSSIDGTPGNDDSPGNLKFFTTPDGSASPSERLRIGSGGGHKITCAEAYYVGNLAECNDSRIALNINKTRQGETKAIAIGAIGGNSATGIQCYDTSNNSANNLLLNPFGGNVGINKSAPSSHAQLDVVGSSYWPILVKTTATNGGGVAIKNKDDVTSLYVGSGGSSWLTGSVITDGLVRAQNNLIFATNGNNERLRIDSSGRVTMPYQPLAIIGTTINNHTPNTGSIIQFNYADTNRGNHYNTSNYTFTCPVNGDYMVMLYLNRDGWTGDLELLKNGTAIKRLELRETGRNSGGNADWQAWCWSFIVPCSANDTLQWKVASTLTDTASSHSGYLLDGYNHVRYDSATYYLIG